MPGVKEEWEARESATAEFERRELDLARRELELERRVLSFLKRSSLTSLDVPSFTFEGVAAAGLSSGTLVGDGDDLPVPPALYQPDAPLSFPEASKSAELQDSVGGYHYLSGHDQRYGASNAPVFPGISASANYATRPMNCEAPGPLGSVPPFPEVLITPMAFSVTAQNVQATLLLFQTTPLGLVAPKSIT